MAITEYTDPNASVFDRRTMRRATGADVPAAIAKASEAAQLVNRMDGFEKRARQVLADHGFPEWPVFRYDGPVMKLPDGRLVSLPMPGVGFRAPGVVRDASPS
jgi:hypothetical protein